MRLSNAVTLLCLACLIVASFGIPVVPRASSPAVTPLAAAAPVLAPRVVRVAVYDESNVTEPAYVSSFPFLNANITDVVSVLTAAGCEVTALTTANILNRALQTARYDVFVLADNLPREVIVNQVKEFWLGGGGILSIDSGISFLCYGGLLPPESEGSENYNVYWNYGMPPGIAFNVNNVTARHPATKAFHVQDMVTIANLEWANFNWTRLGTTSIASQLVRLGTVFAYPFAASMVALDPTRKGGRVVQLPGFANPLTADIATILPDAVNWLCPRPKARIAFDLSHQPYYGVDAWDQLAQFKPRYSTVRDTLVSRTYTFDKLYPAASGNLTAARLAPYDLLVIVLPRTNFTAAEVTAVNAWIAEGGSLLILGDNGGVSIRPYNGYINSLLSSTGLRLENNNTGAIGTYTYHVEHPTTEGCTDFYVVFPGYANYTAPAYPIWGTDAANILVAAQTYGAGRVLLGADINWLDDAGLGNADNEQFAINVANWLTAATAQVLLYTDDSYSPNHYRTPVSLALNDLGVNYHLTFAFSGTNLSLQAQSWRLVIIDNANFYGVADLFNTLVDYLDGGGYLLLTTFDADAAPSHPIWARLGCAHVATMTSEPPVYIWDHTHAIFTTPNPYAPANFTSGTGYSDDGDRFTVFANATALAGFTGTSSSGQAAIILRNDKHTLFNAYLIDNFRGDLDDSTYQDRLELWENEIAFMMAALLPPPPELPWWLLPLVLVIIVVVIIIVVVVLLLRRRKAGAK